MRPLVSIVVPCYKGAGYLPAALHSCAMQSYSPVEVVVVDDGSPDECAAIAEGFAASDNRFRVVRLQTNSGVSRAFNAGFAAARGDYHTRLAQDDWFEPDAVATMVAYLEREASVGLAYFDWCIADAGGRPIATRCAGEPGLLAEINVVGLCVMWRRQVWEAVGGFDPEFDTAEDYEYWLRVAARFRIARAAGRPLLHVRHHPAMGTRVFGAVQPFAHARARCRHLHLSAPERAAAFAHANFEASYAHRAAGRPWRAVPLAVKSVLLRPDRAAHWRAAAGAILALGLPDRRWRGGDWRRQ